MIAGNSIVMPNDLPFKVSQFFRASIFDSLVLNDNTCLLDEILSNSSIKQELSGQSFFYAYNYFFDILNTHYKNEYVFKNILANRIIKGRHKFANVTYINEFHVLNSICDVAVFNGTSTAYEIKTGLDNLDRIDSQLSDYQKIFEKIFIVCDDSKIRVLEEKLPKGIGIIRITSGKHLSTVRDALPNIDLLSHAALFTSLRNSEILNFMYTKYHYVPTASPKKTREDCYELFKGMDIVEAHQEFVTILRNRELNNLEKKLIAQIPFALLALMLNMRLSSKKLEVVLSRLETIIL